MQWNYQRDPAVWQSNISVVSKSNDWRSRLVSAFSTALTKLRRSADSNFSKLIFLLSGMTLGPRQRHIPPPCYDFLVWREYLERYIKSEQHFLLCNYWLLCKLMRSQAWHLGFYTARITWTIPVASCNGKHCVQFKLFWSLTNNAFHAALSWLLLVIGRPPSPRTFLSVC